MQFEERAIMYNKQFEKYPQLVTDKGWTYGMWVMGNNYRSKMKYYGEYPYGYLKRIMSMFSDISEDKILHLFSGVVDVKGIKLDCNPKLNPDILGDAEMLSDLTNKKFQLILADPPYSVEDAQHYGASMINRNKVVKECVKVMEIGGFLVWLDQVLPMYRKAELKLVGTIGMVKSTNHRFRVVSIFQRVEEAD